jgi:hypothetical protein
MALLLIDCLKCSVVPIKKRFRYFVMHTLPACKPHYSHVNVKQCQWIVNCKRNMKIIKRTVLTVRLTILSNSMAGAMWKSNTKYWKKMKYELSLIDVYMKGHNYISCQNLCANISLDLFLLVISVHKIIVKITVPYFTLHIYILFQRKVPQYL